MASLATAAAEAGARMQTRPPAASPAAAPPPPSRSTPTTATSPGGDDQEVPDEQAKRDRRAHKRTKAMHELIQTEETYVKLMGKLIEHYVRPLGDFRLVAEEQHKILFPQVEIINGLNMKFFEDMKSRMDTWDNATTKIGDLFIEFTPFFRMYQNYCNNHERAVTLMRKLMNKKNFVDYGKSQRSDCDGLDLGSMLILPIQRVPRYRMLLSEILKNTEEEHPDFGDLTKALATVSEVNGQINERMKEFERREQVKGIERKFTQQVHLLGPARQYVKSGKLKKVCRNKDRLYEFFLFSDLLIYASSYGGRLNLHNQLSINNAFSVEDVEPGGKYAKYEGRCFKIVSSTKSFVVYADTMAEKEQWFNTIQEVIADNSSRAHLQDQEVTEAAPVWIPDEQAATCQMEDCQNKFNFFNRRHHCRRCGLLVCSSCSKYKLPNADGVEQRACSRCYLEVVGEPETSDGAEDEDDSSEDDNDAYIDALEQVEFYHDSLTATQGENVLRQWGSGTGSYLVVPTEDGGSEDDNTVLLIVEHEHGFEHVPVLMTLKRSGVVFRLRDHRKARDHSTFPQLIESVKHVVCSHPVVRSQTIINNANGGYGGFGVDDFWSTQDFSSYPKAQALYDYETDVLGDLSLKAGDVITVIDREDEEGWWNGIIGNRQGLFPSTYVELIEDKPIPTKVDEPQEGDTLVALFDYQSGGSEELTFHRNDRIVLVDKDDSGWWLGRLEQTGVVGWFAPDLTTRVSDAVPAPVASTSPPPTSNGVRSTPAGARAAAAGAAAASMAAASAAASAGAGRGRSKTKANAKVNPNPTGGLPRFHQSEANVNHVHAETPPHTHTSHDRTQSMRVAPPSGANRGRHRPKAPARNAGNAVPPPRAASSTRIAPVQHARIESAPPWADSSGESTDKYTFDELVHDQSIQGINRARLETYLGDSEFVEVFGVTRSEFAHIPVWKQRLEKKRVGLF